MISELCKIDYFSLGFLTVIGIIYILSSICILIRIFRILFKKPVFEELWWASILGMILNGVIMLPIILGWLIKSVLC